LLWLISLTIRFDLHSMKVQQERKRNERADARRNFNIPSFKSKFPAIPKNIKFGIQPLHSLININKALQKLAAPVKKRKVNQRKRIIANRLTKEFGVISSLQNGNVARKFFNQPKKYAKCLGISVKLVTMISIIVKAVNIYDEVSSNELKFA